MLRRLCAVSNWLDDARGLTTMEYTVLFVIITIGTISLWYKFGPAIAGVIE